MVSFVPRATPPNVVPTPSPTNLNAVTTSLIVPTAERRGVSTAVLFTNAVLSDAADIGVDSNGKPITDPNLKNSDIPDFIANPEKTHFFSMDCASCHTESTRRRELRIPASSFAYQVPDGVSGLDIKRLPRSNWNVRAFGWFETHETITQRTANETAEVADFINRKLLGN